MVRYKVSVIRVALLTLIYIYMDIEEVMAKLKRSGLLPIPQKDV